MLLNAISIKASSAPSAAAAAAARGASAAPASGGPFSISFDTVTNEQIAADLKQRRYVERVTRAETAPW